MTDLERVTQERDEALQKRFQNARLAQELHTRAVAAEAEVARVQLNLDHEYLMRASANLRADAAEAEVARLRAALTDAAVDVQTVREGIAELRRLAGWDSRIAWERELRIAREVDEALARIEAALAESSPTTPPPPHEHLTNEEWLGPYSVRVVCTRLGCDFEALYEAVVPQDEQEGAA
jgi:putative component of toxin-antitoxin plasmid stabilization module